MKTTTRELDIKLRMIMTNYTVGVIRSVKAGMGVYTSTQDVVIEQIKEAFADEGK